MVSFDADTKIVLIEEDPGKAPKRYSTAQVKPYVNDPEEVAVNFMSSLNKAIAYYRDVYDDSVHYSSPICSLSQPQIHLRAAETIPRLCICHRTLTMSLNFKGHYMRICART